MSYMEKKYKLTDETIEVNGKTLYRIEALKDFSNVKKGDKGGFIEKEKNLSHLGNLTTLVHINHWMDVSTFSLLWNILFLTVTSSFVFIKPISRFVDKHIIEKLP